MKLRITYYKSTERHNKVNNAPENAEKKLTPNCGNRINGKSMKANNEPK